MTVEELIDKNADRLDWYDYEYSINHSYINEERIRSHFCLRYSFESLLSISVAEHLSTEIDKLILNDIMNLNENENN